MGSCLCAEVFDEKRDIESVIIVSNDINNIDFSGKEINNFNLLALKIHNKYREKHNAPKLKIDNNLSKKAQKKLNDLINEVENKSIDNEDNDIGENLCIGIGKNINIEEACNSWYNEKNNYNYDLNKYQNNAAHFTQMIWKESKLIGFGYSKLNKGKSYFLALYSPAGNEFLKFKNNVEKNLE